MESKQNKPLKQKSYEQRTQKFMAVETCKETQAYTLFEWSNISSKYLTRKPDLQKSADNSQSKYLSNLYTDFQYQTLSAVSTTLCSLRQSSCRCKEQNDQSYQNIRTCYALYPARRNRHRNHLCFLHTTFTLNRKRTCVFHRSFLPNKKRSQIFNLFSLYSVIQNSKN